MALHKIKVKASSGFSFTGKASELINALNRVMEVTGYVTKNDIGRVHLGIAFDKKFYIIGYSDETQCILEVPGFTSSKDGNVVLLEPDKLKSLFKKRGEVKFTFDGKLHYASTTCKFKGNVTCGSVSDDQLPRIRQIIKRSKIETSPLCPKLLKAIRDGVKVTNITDPHMGKSLLCYVNFSKSKLIVSNFDDQHLAHYEAKVKTKNTDSFKLALPANMFNTVDRFLNESDATFLMNATAFIVTGDGFSIGFPPVQTEPEYFDRTKNFISSMGKENTLCSFTLDNKFKDAQESLRSLTDNGERYTLSIGKNVTLSIGSDFGNASDSFKAKDLKINGKKKVEVKIDPKILNDLLPLINVDEFPFKIHTRNGEVKLYTLGAQLGSKKDEGFLLLMGNVNQ